MESVLTQALSTLWESADLPSDFIEHLDTVCQPLFPKSGEQSKHPLHILPHLFCEHVGGDPQLLNSILIAWNILRQAARILDDFEDGDIQEGSKAGLLLNTSTGLIFSANMLLSNLENEGAAPEVAQAIRQRFYSVLLQTCYGQHLDLLSQQPSLETRWQITRQKSGYFLGLITWISARLGIDDPEQLGLYQEFGEILGIMDQIHDDLVDLKSTEQAAGDLTRPYHWSLPAAYAFSVLPEPQQTQLQTYLDEASSCAQAEAKAREIIIQSGAGLYLTVQLTIYSQRGQKLVQQMELRSKKVAIPLGILEKLCHVN